jgi:glycosidase
MKKITWLFILQFAFLFLSAQDEISIERVEPPFWWVEMHNTDLQIMIYGSDIALYEPEINYDGIELLDVVLVENPNYLFLNIEMSSNVIAGTFEIDFKRNGEMIKSIPYELKERKEGSASRNGFDKSDVIYLLMPDRFSNGNTENDNMEGMLETVDRSNPSGRHGGDIQGVLNHLDFIDNLGFSALWINPLLENNNPQYSYHGYAITDFYKIDPRYGSNEDYYNLVDACHQKGIKVINDMIFNHCSIHHWFIKDLPDETWIHQYPEFTKSNFRAPTLVDPHASDFDKTKMLTGWFDVHMADLDQRNELLAHYLIQNTIWWIEVSGIDGIRVDTQPYPYKEFISQWAKAVFDEYPNFNIVGEAWLQKESFTAYFQKSANNADGYNSNIPSVTDFPLRNAIVAAFNENDGWVEGLLRLYYVLAQDFLYIAPEENLIFCDNHDLSRFYSTQGEDIDKWKMGMAFLLTTRGIPMIYYGSEILMSGEEHMGHGFIRQDFPGGWKGDTKNAFIKEGRTDQQNDAYNFLYKLLQWRKSKDVIHYGQLKHYIPEDNVYVYFRYNEQEQVMVIFNNSKNEVKALDTERFKESFVGFNYAKNVLTNEIVKYTDVITLSPKSVTVLELIK